MPCGAGWVGHAGAVYHGLQYTPDGKYVVYPLGAMIVVKNLASDTQVREPAPPHAACGWS